MKKPNCTGFTLIEILIVVVIVAILMAIAVPSYQESVRKSRRADCKDKLFSVAQAQERHFSEYARYAGSLTGAESAANLGWPAANLVADGGGCTVTLTASSNTTYTLTGTPATADPDCGNLTLSHLGVKDSVVAGDRCW